MGQSRRPCFPQICALLFRDRPGISTREPLDPRPTSGLSIVDSVSRASPRRITQAPAWGEGGRHAHACVRHRWRRRGRRLALVLRGQATRARLGPLARRASPSGWVAAWPIRCVALPRSASPRSGPSSAQVPSTEATPLAAAGAPACASTERAGAGGVVPIGPEVVEAVDAYGRDADGRRRAPTPSRRPVRTRGRPSPGAVPNRVGYTTRIQVLSHVGQLEGGVVHPAVLEVDEPRSCPWNRTGSSPDSGRHGRTRASACRGRVACRSTATTRPSGSKPGALPQMQPRVGRRSPATRHHRRRMVHGVARGPRAGGGAESECAQARRSSPESNSASRGDPGTRVVATAGTADQLAAGYPPAASPGLRRRHSPWPPDRRHHPAKEFPPPKRRCALLPSPDLPGSSWWSRLEGRSARGGFRRWAQSPTVRLPGDEALPGRTVEEHPVRVCLSWPARSPHRRRS